MRRPARRRAPAVSRVGQRGLYLTIRVTGVLLAVLALGHYGLTHIIYDVAETDSGLHRPALVLGPLDRVGRAAPGRGAPPRHGRDDDGDPGPRTGPRFGEAVDSVGAGATVVLFIIGVAALTYSVIGKI